MCQAKISYFHEVQDNPYYLDRERVELPQDFYLTDALNDYAASFLDEALAHEKPFLLYVAHIAPHWPLHTREADVARYRERYRTLGWDQLRSPAPIAGSFPSICGGHPMQRAGPRPVRS